jgi:hypothetical protein
MPGSAWGLAAGVTCGRGVGCDRGDRLGLGVAMEFAVSVRLALRVIAVVVAGGLVIPVRARLGMTLGVVVGLEVAVSVGVGTSAGSQFCMRSLASPLFFRYTIPTRGGECASAWLAAQSRIAATIADGEPTNGRKYTMPVDLFIPPALGRILYDVSIHPRMGPQSYLVGGPTLLMGPRRGRDDLEESALPMSLAQFSCTHCRQSRLSPC